MTVLRVHDFKGFPNPARVRIALAEKGLFEETEFVHVDVPGGEHKTSEFLRRNPSGAVPVLELADGTMISECSAITEYLDHLQGEPTLTGQTPKERAVIAMTQRRVKAGLLDAVAAYFHHATEGLGPEIETYQNVEWGQKQLDRALSTMRWMNDELASHDYLAGDRFTIADITAMAGFSFADFVKIEIPKELAHIQQWRNRVANRPSAALAA